MKKVILAGLVASASLLLAGCATSPPASPGPASDCVPAHEGVSTLIEGTLEVSVYVSPPYTDLASAGGDLGGIDGEIIKKLTEMECLTLHATPVEGAGVIASVQSERADAAIGGVNYSEERAATLSLTDAMYRDGMAVLSKDGLKSIGDLTGKRTGVVQGYFWNEQLQTALGGGVVVYQDSAGMLNDLSAGRVDAVILTSAEAAYRAAADATYTAETFEPDDAVPASQQLSDVVIVLVKGNDSLTDAFNDDLVTLLDNGEIADILKANGMDPELAGPSS